MRRSGGAGGTRNGSLMTGPACFGCTKELLQAKVDTVFYLHDWVPANARNLPEYKKIQAAIPHLKRVKVRDPDAAWAKG